MKQPFTTTLALVLLAISVSAQKIGVSSSLGMGCWNCAKKYDFGCDSRALTANCLCDSENFMGTVLACVSKHGQNEKEMTQGFGFVSQYCRYNGNKTYSRDQLHDIYQEASKILIKSGAANALHTLNTPIEMGSDEFEIEFEVAQTTKYQYDLGAWLGVVLLFYWGLVVALGSIMQYIRLYIPGSLSKYNPYWVDSIRRHITLPALYRGRHGAPFVFFKHFSINAPTRGQSLIILGYIILNAIVLLVFYQIDAEKNEFFGSQQQQLLRYVGSRTGIIGFTQLPLVVMFASRNNPFIDTTGWAYCTFQVYHHWVARILMLHALIHGVCFTWLAVMTHSIAFRWKFVVNWRFGHAGLIAGILILLLSLKVLRRTAYETFAILHKILFIAFMVGLYWHCIDFGWMPWVNVSLGIYAFDRAARIAKMIWSGVQSKAVFSVHRDGSIKIAISYSGRWKPRPGSFVYLRVLTKDLCWQSHPFSVFKGVGADDKTINLAIRPKKGLTKTLKDMALTSKEGIVTLPVLIDGPYGHVNPLVNYDNVVLMAGGIGTTATYSYASWLVENARPEQRILFLWTMPSNSSTDWFGRELLHLAQHPCFSLRVHLTNSMFCPQGDALDPEQSLTVAQSFDDLESSHVRSVSQALLPYLYEGRPDITTIIKEVITKSEGNIAIASCGPPTFIDNARDSIVAHLHSNPARIDYFEEAFSW